MTTLPLPQEMIMKDNDSGRRASAEPATHEPSPSVPLVSALTGECQAQELQEALAFARSEARRNGDLACRLSYYEAREKRDYEAALRVRDILKQNGYLGGSYLGIRLVENGRAESIGDAKYTPPIALLEQFVLHLLDRIASVDTHPQGGDSAQTEAPAPLSGAVPSQTADAQTPSHRR